MIIWKIRRTAHDAAPHLSADTQVFVGSLGKTMQLTGQLRLTGEEADELAARLQHPLSPREYERLITFLTKWEEQDDEARKLAEIVRRKFGASSRRNQPPAPPEPLSAGEFAAVWQVLVDVSDTEERRIAARIMERFKPTEAGVQG